MPRPASLWTTLTLRIPPEVEAVVRQAERQFYSESNRPLTDPVALGFMVEQLCADYLAGPASPHPGAAIRRELAAFRTALKSGDAGCEDGRAAIAATPTKETT